MLLLPLLMLGPAAASSWPSPSSRTRLAAEASMAGVELLGPDALAVLSCCAGIVASAPAEHCAAAALSTADCRPRGRSAGRPAARRLRCQSHSREISCAGGAWRLRVTGHGARMARLCSVVCWHRVARLNAAARCACQPMWHPQYLNKALNKANSNALALHCILLQHCKAVYCSHLFAAAQR